MFLNDKPVWDEYSDIKICSHIFRRIYSFVQIFVIFFQGKYIRIFICHLFMLTNIFRYSFVQKMVIFFYYWSKMVQYGYKITQHMKMAKIVQNSVGKIIWYSNKFEYFGQIYSFTKKFVDFFMGKIIWSFVISFFMPNIFGYSFVP